MIAHDDREMANLEEAELGRPSNEDIEALAYALWESRGCPEGSADEDWLRAEQELSAS